MVCAHCGSTPCGLVHKGQRLYLCRGYIAYGKTYCHRNAVPEQTVLHFLARKLREAFLDPAHLKRLRRELAAQEARDRRDGNLSRLRRQADDLGQKIRQGNERLAILPADRIPGLVERLRA